MQNAQKSLGMGEAAMLTVPTIDCCSVLGLTCEILGVKGSS